MIRLLLDINAQAARRACENRHFFRYCVLTTDLGLFGNKQLFIAERVAGLPFFYTFAF